MVITVSWLLSIDCCQISCLIRFFFLLPSSFFDLHPTKTCRQIVNFVLDNEILFNQCVLRDLFLNKLLFSLHLVSERDETHLIVTRPASWKLRSGWQLDNGGIIISAHVNCKQSCMANPTVENWNTLLRVHGFYAKIENSNKKPCFVGK